MIRGGIQFFRPKPDQSRGQPRLRKQPISLLDGVTHGRLVITPARVGHDRVFVAMPNYPDRDIFCTVSPGNRDLVRLVELGFAGRLDRRCCCNNLSGHRDLLDRVAHHYLVVAPGRIFYRRVFVAGLNRPDRNAILDRVIHC